MKKLKTRVSFHIPLSHRQKGMTLIEVLVAVLVLSVGLLGLAALQGISLQSNQNAYNRTQAVSFVYEAVDFARANRSAIFDECKFLLQDDESFRKDLEQALPGYGIKT